jgi:hypothetical protein
MDSIRYECDNQREDTLAGNVNRSPFFNFKLIVDYGFALLFGILFQYFSIAPMSGDWGLRSLIRAAKADVASLTAFEIGLFGWMAIYQIAIWNWRLGMVTTVYWWMMQVGMILGFLTAFPMNWVLIKYRIKEPHIM